ncbi:hypothetical protein [Pontibacillus halophilus]|nr:hypothetical protein [Pontibacillus halophilus]
MIVVVGVSLLFGCVSEQAATRNEEQEKPAPEENHVNEEQQEGKEGTGGNEEDESDKWHDQILLRDFIVSITEDSHLEVHLEYQITDQLVSYINEQEKDYAFVIRYPERLQSKVEKQKSEPYEQPFPAEDDSLRSFETSFTDELYAENKEEVVSDLSGFDLIVEEDGEEVYIINDIFNYVGYSRQLLFNP